MTLSALVEEFLVDSRDRRRVSPGTLVAYRIAFDPVFGPGGPLAGFEPGALTPVLIDDAYRLAAKARRWRTRTLHGKLAHVRALLRWLARRGLVPPELREQIELPRYTQRPPAVLSTDEVRLLYDGVEVLFKRASRTAGRFDQAVELRFRRHAMLGLLIFGGLRAGEVGRAKRRDLGQRTDGGTTLAIPPSKWGAPRVIPLNPQLVYALSAYFEHRADRNHPNVICSAWRPGQDSPRDRFEGRELDGSDITRDLKIVAAEVLPDVKVTSNLMRHTCATMLADAGVSPFELKAYFGWRRLETALQYVPVSQPMVRRVERAFKRLTTPFGFMAPRPE